MAWPNPLEVAELTVGGVRYRDWETVLVKHALREPPLYSCRFTCSEGQPLSKNWATMQIMTGDECTVTLGGILAFSGRVTTRQVFYDARRHYIEIQCTVMDQMFTSSVIHKSGEFKEKTFEQIAREILRPLGIPFRVEGGALPSIKIPVYRVEPGISVFDALDRIARAFSKEGSPVGISFTSSTAKELVAIVGPTGGSDAVVEGKNILEGREIIYAPQFSGGVPQVNQAPGTDKKNMSSVAHEPFFSETFKVLGKAFNPSLIVAEFPYIDRGLLKGRSTSDRNWLAEDYVTVYATVQGWMRPSGGLWDRGQQVTVTSPMLVMEGVSLLAKSVTFTQDTRNGTRTTLELVNAMADGGGVPRPQ